MINVYYDKTAAVISDIGGLEFTKITSRLYEFHNSYK